ncbi:unnamed protein product [Cylicostephanus goldi]|uniref:SSD domain-containing protein n=1 Tax=Cylicostephanus goldi TaxID=71465 RepID=A0A3P6TDT7_CYLGO|nr:unnamed protein product [Cylicostephanus goldi]
MGSEEKVVPPAQPLLYSQIPFYQTNLTDTPVIVDMIEEVREVCERYTANGLSNFPSGIAFTFWEQYLSLRWNLFCAICIIAFAVFAVISIMMFNPWAAAMVMVIVVIVTIELGGFMGLLGVKMNPISAVTLICAVGIGELRDSQRNCSRKYSIRTFEMDTAQRPVIKAPFTKILMMHNGGALG